MTDQNYQLLRIIIIDSFWKGQVNELDLSGHTQLEGTNGAGKTSLMRLLPLFYGMRPSEIVSKVDQTHNFVDFYLPRDSSLLVYEYKRPYGQTCMVLASSDGRGVHFKFIDGAYCSERFIGEDKKLFLISEIERLYRHNNCGCSGYLGADKYCQVIQNLRGGRKLKDVRALQNKYSFSDRPMPHIDKVINGTLEKSLDFNAVKRMLVAISSDKLARNTLNEKEQKIPSKETIRYWLADLQACRMVEQQSQKIELWQADFNTLESQIIKLQHSYAQAIDHQSELNAQNETKQADKILARDKGYVLNTELEETTENLNTQINQLNNAIAADQSQIDDLDERKQSYDDKDAALFQIKADEAPHIEQKLNEVKEIIAAFEGDISKITGKFEKLIAALNLQKVTDIAENNNKMADIKDRANEQLEKINETHQIQHIALNTQLEQRRLELKLNLQKIAHELKKCAAQQDYPILPAQLTDSIEENQVLLQATQETLTLFLQNLARQNKTLSLLEKQRDKLLEKRQQENRYLEKLTQLSLDIDAQLLPINNSLHQFLAHCEEAKGWKENIGRILSNEQLNRTDLAPSWQSATEQHNDNIYGLQIELLQLPESDLHLSESQLREKARALDEKHLVQKQSIDGIDASLGALNKQITQQKESITTFEQQLTQTEMKVEQLKIQKQKLSEKKQCAIYEITNEIKARIEQLTVENKQQQKKLQLFEEDANSKKSELHNILLEQRMVIETDRDTQLDKLNSLEADIELSAKTRLKDHRQQKNKSLAELDPDGEVDKRSADQRILTSQLEQCAVWSNKAKEYRAFMERSYIKRDPLMDDTQNNRIKLRGLENNLEDFRQNKNQQITTQAKIIKRLSTQIADNDKLLLLLGALQKECDLQGITALADENEPNNDAELTIVFCRDWLSAFGDLHKLLENKINSFKDNFRKNHPRSELFANWEKSLIENDTFVGAKNLFKYQKPIQDLLSSAVQKKENTYQLVTVNAHIINEFYQHIEHFGRTIKNIGKDLSKNVTSLASFEALAGINVYTVMKQEPLGYWGPLQDFAKLFARHRDNFREGIEDIPDDLLYAMEELSKDLPSEGFELAHETLFDIEFAITEKGQLKRARNAKQLKKISSTGLSYLAMLSLFSGLLVMLRGSNANHSNIILPVDELGELAAENIDLLLKMFSANAISMLSASPSTNRHILSLYDKHYKLKDNKIYYAQIPVSRIDELIAMRNKQQAPRKRELSHV